MSAMHESVESREEFFASQVVVPQWIRRSVMAMSFVVSVEPVR